MTADEKCLQVKWDGWIVCHQAMLADQVEKPYYQTMLAGKVIYCNSFLGWEVSTQLERW